MSHLIIGVMILLIGVAGGIVIGRRYWPRIVEAESLVIKDALAIPAEIRKTAEKITAEVEKKFSDMEGEFKRAQVYRALINSFPDASKKVLGLAIEVTHK